MSEIQYPLEEIDDGTGLIKQAHQALLKVFGAELSSIASFAIIEERDAGNHNREKS